MQVAEYTITHLHPWPNEVGVEWPCRCPGIVWEPTRKRAIRTDQECSSLPRFFCLFACLFVRLFVCLTMFATHLDLTSCFSHCCVTVVINQSTSASSLLVGGAHSPPFIAYVLRLLNEVSIACLLSTCWQTERWETQAVTSLWGKGYSALWIGVSNVTAICSSKNNFRFCFFFPLVWHWVSITHAIYGWHFWDDRE